MHLTAPKIAYELDVNEQKLIEWINTRGSAMTRVASSQPEKVKAITTELAEKYPVATSEERKRIQLNPQKIAKLLAEGYKLPEVAKKLGIPWDDFIYAYTLIQKAVTKAIGQLNAQI